MIKWLKDLFKDFFTITPGEGVVPISPMDLPTVKEYVYMGDGTMEEVEMTWEEHQKYLQRQWQCPANINSTIQNASVTWAGDSSSDSGSCDSSSSCD